MKLKRVYSLYTPTCQTPCPRNLAPAHQQVVTDIGLQKRMNERGHIRDAGMIEIHMMTGTHLTGKDTRMMKTLDDPVVVATARSEEDTNVTTTKSGKIDAMVETEEVVLLRVGRPPRPNEPW